MAKADQHRFTRIYHTIVAILILIAGAGLLGIGIWLTVSDNGGPLNLNYSNDDRATAVILRANIAAIIAGGFLLLTGVVSIIALSKACFGITFRIIYVFMAFIIFVILLGITVASSFVLARRDNSEVRDFMRDAWTRTTESEPSVVCQIENTFECRGFDNNDCAKCITGLEQECDVVKSVCAKCTDTTYTVDPAVGCFKRVSDLLKNLLLPMAIVSGVLAVVVLLDMFFTCCL